MKTIFILSFILLFLSFNSKAQQTIDKLNVNQLKLPKESSNKALILDGAGQVKSSSTISDTELGYLEGLSDTLVNLLSGKANDSDVVKLTGNQTVGGIKTFDGKFVTSSTVNGAIPCPVMTETQRNAFTPAQADCVYNSTSLKLNVFDGSVWKDVGGAGGISLWLTANPYNVNDIIIESDKIYRCLIAHTSGTFATDLSASKWTEVSQGLTAPVSLAYGGTNKNITASSGSVVYVDADSFEQVSGTSGQVLQSNGSSAPTFVNKSISAKSQNNASVIAEEIQVPNNLLTQIDTNKHLNETGNKNILSNPSFEHSTFSTSWTNVAGTFTQETSIVIDGKASAKLVLSAQTMSLVQSSTLYQAQFADGVQGLASVRIKSDVALKVCSVQAGTVSTTNCVNVVANNKWGLYKVPFILGGTSNGISIASSGAVSGTAYIDDAFTGTTSLTQEMNACNDVSCETEFSARVSSLGVASAENKDLINSCSRSTTGTYSCSFNSGIFSFAPNCSVSPITSAFNTISRDVIATSSGIDYKVVNVGGTPTLNDQEVAIICQKQGADFIAAKQLSNGNTYSSTNADTDWASCGHTAASFIGFGAVSSISTQCKRDGSDLLVKGTYTTQTGTAVELRLSLPSWNGSQLTSAGSSIIPSVQLAGKGNRNVPSAAFFSGITLLIEPSVSYITFGGESSTLSGEQKALGTQLANTGPYNWAINARIPIAGWTDSNIIIGQFNGLESCTDTLECTDTFSAKISSTGVVSGENIEWLNGNCTVSPAGTFTCPFVSSIFTQEPNCSITVDGSANGVVVKTAASSNTSLVYNTTAGTTGNPTSYASEIICQKQGADYIGKTAKAVASDQNLRTPGITKAVFYSTKVSSTGVVSNEQGDFISTCTNPTTGNFTCSFNSQVFASTPNCQANMNASISTASQSASAFNESTSSVSILVLSGGAVSNQAFNLSCHGVSP